MLFLSISALFSSGDVERRAGKANCKTQRKLAKMTTMLTAALTGKIFSFEATFCAFNLWIKDHVTSQKKALLCNSTFYHRKVPSVMPLQTKHDKGAFSVPFLRTIAPRPTAGALSVFFPLPPLSQHVASGLIFAFALCFCKLFCSFEWFSFTHLSDFIANFRYIHVFLHFFFFLI